MILAQTVLHLCVNEAYEKYIKMIIGLIMAMMLLLPVLDMIRDGGYETFESYREIYETKMFGAAPDFEKIKDDAWKNYREGES